MIATVSGALGQPARLGAVLAVCALALNLYLVIRQLDRPLMYDDANFALAARAIADTGLPFGNQGWMSDRGDFSHQDQWALWHPPLYIYLLGGLARLAGWTPAVLRLPGILSSLATASVVWLLAAELARGTRELRHLAGGLAASLVLLCPLAVQSALVLDIDFSLLLPLSLLFLLGYIRLEHAPWRWLWLVPLFALLLWAKMTNPIPLLLVASVWQVLRGRFGRAGRHLVGIGVGGAAGFLISWRLLSQWLNMPFEMPFQVNLVQWQDSAEVARRAYTSPSAFIDGLQPTIIWLGPGLVALGLLGASVRVGQLVCHLRFAAADLLIGYALALVFGYVNKEAGWFPKYQVALAPILACLAAPLVAAAWCQRPRLVAPIAASASLAAAVIDLRLVRDDWALQRTWALEAGAATWLLGAIGAAAVLGLVWRAPAVAALASLLGIALGWSLGTDAYQSAAGYSTYYWYGTTGTSAAADWIDQHLRPGALYLAAKEVAIRSTDPRYVDQDNLVYLLSAGRGFDGTWAGQRLAGVVAWQREPYVADLFGRALPAAGFAETSRAGDYVVYEPVAGS